MSRMQHKYKEWGVEWGVVKIYLTFTNEKGTLLSPTVVPRSPSVVRLYCYLLMRVNVDVALDTFLSHVGPGVPTHPLPLAFGAFIFSEAPLLSLIRGQAFTFGSSLNRNGQ